MTKIGVIGAGAWGTALAQCLAAGGKDVLLWAREHEVVESINTQRENTLYLPSIILSESIKATESLSEAASADIILLVTPAQHVRATLKALRGEITDGKPVVICSKGIEISTGQLMIHVADEEVPGATIAILTGPTFAREIANGLPSAVTIAAKDKDVAQEIRDVLATRALRPYITDDVIGAEIGGAVKNVIAIASGMVIGKGLGESARAALIARGLAEMGRLGSAMGADKDTLSGMCGIGDLVLTATSMQSRNYSFGVAFGEGKTTEQILGSRNAVTEGFYTAEALVTMARNQAVEMPICRAVYDCLAGNKTLDEGIKDLLDRPLTDD